MKNKIIAFKIVALLILTFMISACQKPPDKIPSFRIGHAPHDHHSPLYIAAMNPQYFKNNGGTYLKEVVFKEHYQLMQKSRILAEIIIEPSNGGKELIRKLNENIYDMTFGGVPAMLSFIDKGSSLRMLAPSNAEGAGFVVNADLPVNSWKEFVEYVKSAKRPVRIGYKIAISVQNLIFEEALRSENISFSKSLDKDDVSVILLNMHGAKNLIPALKDKIIDGFVVNQPFIAKAQVMGGVNLVDMLENLPPEGQWYGSPCCAVAASDHFVKQNPEIAKAITTLLLRANQLISTEPSKSIEQVAKWLNVPLAVEERSIPTIKFTTDFDEPWNKGVDFWVKSMVNAGKLNGLVKNAYHNGTLTDLIYDLDLYNAAKREID